MKYLFFLFFLTLNAVLASCSDKDHKAYPMTPQLLTALEKFKAQDKFSAAAWESRGLMPSPVETVTGMDHAVNSAIDEIISSGQNLDEEKIKEIIKAHLQEAGDLDTEEREFLAGTFYTLATILKVDIKDVLNSYMYSFG